MFAHSTYFGIDSHARTTTVCAVVAETGEVRTRTFRGTSPYAEASAWMSSFPQPSLGVYESGCTGFVPARMLTGGGVRVVPAATSRIPASPESRSKKSDRRDAERLARLAMAGGFAEVWVPDEGTEGLRDLAHAIDDLARERASARLRVDAQLLRHGLVWDERTRSGSLKKAWGAEHWAWVESARLPDPASQAALDALVDAARSAERRHAELVERARSLASASGRAAAVDALRCIKGVGFVTALSFCAEVGDFSRFASGRRVTSYFGLAPREASSGLAARSGPITRAGCRMVRRLLVEGAWTHGSARAAPSRAKRGPKGVPERVRAAADRGSRRLTLRRRALLERGVAPCKANAATAAELARWMWAVGLEAQSAAPGA